MENDDERIWRYMELGKFLYLLQKKKLYLSRYCDFEDPLEGLLPKKYTQAIRSVIDTALYPRNLIERIKSRMTEREADELDVIIQSRLEDARYKVQGLDKKFGVSSWKIGNDECAAMWKIVPDDSIAVVSTIGGLKKSLPTDIGIIYDRVRYRDFRNDDIDKGHRNYSLFIKDLPFSFENEFRAALLLENNKDNENVECDIGNLVYQVYVSPYAGKYLLEIIKSLCAASHELSRVQVVQSEILAKTDKNSYEIIGCIGT